MLNNIFKDSIISVISIKTAAEYDNIFQSYLSYSFDENTVIFTDHYSLLQNKEKYNSIYSICNWDDVLSKLKDIHNKTIFIDVYYDNIAIVKKIGRNSNYLGISDTIKDVYSLCMTNNLNIVFISQNGSANTNRNNYYQLLQMCDLWIEYDSIHKDIFIKKTRYFSSNIFLNVLHWKNKLRKKKIQKLLK